jgi:hypothetical protein
MAVDYDSVIADLEARRTAFNAAIDNAIQSLRHVMAAGAGGAAVPISEAAAKFSTPSASVTPDAFFGMGLAEAAIKLLQIVKKQQKTREIADALEAANYHHTSANFVNTVNTALYRRARDEKDVIKIGRSWALAEWYPGRRKGMKASLRPSDFVEADEPQSVATDETDASDVS